MLVPETQLEDIISGQEQSVRGFFGEFINGTYSKNFRTYTDYKEVSMQQLTNLNTFDHRLAFCLEKELISFLRKKGKTGDDVLILQNVIEEMRKSGINNVHGLKELASLIGGKYNTPKLGGTTVRTVTIPKIKLIKFILPDITED